MKRIILMIALTLLSVSCGGDLEAHKKPDNSLTIVSFNVRSDNDGKLSDGQNSWCYRQDASYDMFNEIEPDVCGIQEARIHQKYDLQMNTVGYEFIGVGRDDGLNKGEHMLIAYMKKKVKLLDWGTYWLSETPDVPSKGWDAAYIRTATWAKFKHTATGREFFFVNTHLDNKGSEAKRNGLALIVDKMKSLNPDKLPVILTGDFNMTPGDEKMADLEKEMYSARTAAELTDDSPSFNEFGKGRYMILDYIYYCGFSTCKKFWVINQQFGSVPYISDHYPIATILEW